MFLIGFSYRYTYKKGNSRLKTDTSFVYLFPLAQGKVVRVNKMVSLDNFMGKEGEEAYHGDLVSLRLPEIRSLQPVADS